MRDRQRLGDCDPDFTNLVQRHRTFAQPLGQSFSFEKLHHQIVGAILRANVVELADVRMVQRRNRPRLALHALFQLRRRRKMRGENFDRDRAVEARVAGAIHFSHAARAEQRLNFVWTEFRARG